MADTPREGTWDQLKLLPSQLMRMVVDGTATVVGRDKYGRLIYRVYEKKGPARG